MHRQMSPFIQTVIALQLFSAPQASRSKTSTAQRGNVYSLN
jgi:hypothetical protein